MVQYYYFNFIDSYAEKYTKEQYEKITEKVIFFFEDFRDYFTNNPEHIDLKISLQDICVGIGIIINSELSEYNDQLKAEEYAEKYIDYAKDYLDKFPEGNFNENFSFSAGYYYYAVYKDYQNALKFFLKAKEYGGTDFFVKEGWTFSIMMMYMLERYDECSKLCQEFINSDDFDEEDKLSGYLYLARSLSAIGEITSNSIFYKSW
jgi:tetratricopeptide (TPR) repeat protein